MTTIERIIIHLEMSLLLAERAAEIADDSVEPSVDYEPNLPYDEVVKAQDAIYVALRHLRRMEQ